MDEYESQKNETWIYLMGVDIGGDVFFNAWKIRFLFCAGGLNLLQ